MNNCYFLPGCIDFSVISCSAAHGAHHHMDPGHVQKLGDFTLSCKNTLTLHSRWVEVRVLGPARVRNGVEPSILLLPVVPENELCTGVAQAQARGNL